MKHYTYLIQYEDGMLYHGVHSAESLNNEYLGSSKYTPDDSVVAKYILTTHGSREEAVAEEVWYHQEYDVKAHENYYNKANQTSVGFDTTGITYSEETLAKMSKASTGRRHTAKTKSKISKAKTGCKHTEKAKAKMRGREFSEEHKAKISKAHIGKKLSEEHKIKLRATGLGRKHSEESKDRMSEAHTGKKLSEEHKNNLSKAHTGKKLSEEHKIKLRASAKVGSDSHRYDSALYTFQHKDGTVETCTKLDLYTKYSLIQSGVSLLTSKKRKTHKGWSLIDNK